MPYVTLFNSLDNATKGNFVYYEGKIKVICGLPANEITCYQTSHDHD